MTQARITGIFNLQPYEIDFTKPAMQVWRKLPEKFPAEVIDGKLYVSPRPTLYHTRLSGHLFGELRTYVQKNTLGEVFCDGVGVFLKKKNNVVGPDVVFVSKRNKKLLSDKKGVCGPPDLCIEVLSPSNHKYDLTTKKKLYEKAGVKEYWAVDPETKKAQGFLLKEGAYGNPLCMNSKIHVRILDKEIQF